MAVRSHWRCRPRTSHCTDSSGRRWRQCPRRILDARAPPKPRVVGREIPVLRPHGDSEAVRARTRRLGKALRGGRYSWEPSSAAVTKRKAYTSLLFDQIQCVTLGGPRQWSRRNAAQVAHANAKPMTLTVVLLQWADRAFFSQCLRRHWRRCAATGVAGVCRLHSRLWAS